MKTALRTVAMRALQSERGITLTEVVVVGVLAAIVMLALTGFYVNSQGTWIDASTQAVTQRELSLVLETIRDSVHVANSASVNPATGTIILLDSAGSELCRFWIASTDSMIHLGKGTGMDRGPIGTSRVTRFEVAGTAASVKVLSLEMKTATGQRVSASTLASFYNK